MTSTETTTHTQLDGQLARRTLRALAGSALGILPLLQLLSDAEWVIQAWISMAIVIVPVALLRLRYRAHAVQYLPGLVLLIGYLTRVYVASHAWLGVIPTRQTWTDLRALSTALGRTIRDSAAPLNSTPAARLYLSMGLVVLAIIVDLLVVELARPALAGVPLLLIYTLSGAIPRDPVSWIWFALAGSGYLLMLSSTSTDDLHRWGRVVARPEYGSRSRLTTALSGRRIGVVAVLVAVLVPFLLPLGSVNVLANALHNGKVGVGGNGKGSTGVVIDPLAVLRGELTRSDPVKLFTVQVSGAAANEAFYLRTTILESYTGKAWVQGSPAPTVPATSDNYTVAPANVTSDSNTSQFNATISIAKLGATPPLFATPSALSNIPSSWAWSQRYGILAGNVKAGQTYVETVEQPDPSRAQLEAASAGPASLGGPGRSVLQQNLATVDVPSVVNDLVSKITAGKSSPYDKAEALSSYFTNPANGFIYSLQTRAGESGNDLVDFLTTGKAGFCQQYAAALGVMLRVAGIPARVVLGYTHPAPDSHGQFLVTSDDAHAWVEAYFNGIGWVPFDPTPLVGVDAARAVALPWAPHPTSVTASDPAAPRPGLDLAGKDPQSSGNLTSSSSNNANDSGLLAAWLGAAAFVVLLILAALTPFLLRVRLRRRRLHQSAQIGPEPAWAELAATARDLELGWSDARSPRQVVSWLGEMVLSAPPRAALRELAGGIERARYAGAGHDESGDRTRWADAVEQVSRELRAVSPRAVRLRARFLPHSLRTSAEDGETSRPDTRERVGSDRA